MLQDDRYEIRFSGSGGQGMITAAVIFAEAAVLEGKFVSQTQSYGPEARGGASKAEVVVSTKEIDYPKVIQLDLLLAMNQISCDTYFYNFKPSGLLVVDATFVEQVPTSRVVSIPFTQMARDDFANEVVANMIALGAIAQFCEVIGAKNLELALAARVPKATVGLNLGAFHAGLKAAAAIDADLLPRSIFPEEHEI